MADFGEWQVSAAVAAGLEQLGWNAEDAVVREILPPVLRGTNVVAVLPPSPASAGPIVGALAAALETTPGRVLVLSPTALVAEWGALFAAVTAETGLRIEAARGPARATRRLKADALDVLIASPETALDLHTRSALAPEQITAIVFAWPEGWNADEAMLVLLQDLPKDAQRVVLTTDAEASAELVERYARRAVMIGAPSEGEEQSPVAAIRTVATPWASRATVVASLLEATDPHLVAIWTSDRRDHGILRAALGGVGEGVSLVVREAPRGGTIICYDLPSLTELQVLAEAGDVTILVPPGTEAYASHLAIARRPVTIEAAAATLLQRDAGLRSEITDVLSAGPDAAALYALAPLFERWEPQQVAAALFRLWQSASLSARAVHAAATPTTTAVGGVHATRVWIGVGKKDDATVGDVVAVLAREVGLDRSLIGRVDLRDAFTLVEVPASEAERVALKLVGLTIRKRKLSARVDRGPDGGSRGGGGGGGGGRPPFRLRS